MKSRGGCILGTKIEGSRGRERELMLTTFVTQHHHRASFFRHLPSYIDIQSQRINILRKHRPSYLRTICLNIPISPHRIDENHYRRANPNMGGMREWIIPQIRWNGERWKPSKGGSDSKSEVSSINSTPRTSITSRHNGTRPELMVMDSSRDLLGYGSILINRHIPGMPRKRGWTRW